MKWRSRSRRQTSLAKPDVVIARAAARDAGKRLEETQKDWPRVTALANTMTEMRLENHFAERIRTAILGGQ